MERYVRLEEISDGRLYGPNDMVRADCGGCEGCPASCCRGMGKTIVLDPLDVYRMTTALGVKFEELLRDKIELNVADGLILPCLLYTSQHGKRPYQQSAQKDCSSRSGG